MFMGPGPDGYQPVGCKSVEMVSLFSACTAIHVLLIYTTELFPTCVRNSAISMVRQTFVLAGVFSPVLAAAGWQNGILSYGVFGVTIAFCGSFVTFLPETKGSRICDTMDEEEQKLASTTAIVSKICFADFIMAIVLSGCGILTNTL